MMKKILVVDDDPLYADLLRIMLTHAGHDVSVFGNGSDVLAYLSDNDADVVISDISMPEMSGEELCTAIRTSQIAHAPRMVAHTAHDSESERQSLLEVGFDEIIIKPASRKSLLSALGDLH